MRYTQYIRHSKSTLYDKIYVVQYIIKEEPSMHPIIAQLKTYLENNPVSIQDESYGSVTELLWYFYTMYYPINEEELQKNLLSLAPVVETLPRKRQRRIFYALTHMCKQQERGAFLEGLRVGAQLASELEK